MGEVVTPFRPRSVKPGGALETVCAGFLRQLANRGRAVATINAYRTDLEQLVGFCLERGIQLVQSISPALIEDWVDALIEGEGVTARSAARKVATVRGLFNYAEVRNLVDPAYNPTRQLAPIQFEARRVIAPDMSSLVRLIESIPVDDIHDIRDRAALWLMADAALRIGGVLSLDVYAPDAPPKWHVNPQSGIVYYRAKGGRTGDSVVSDMRSLLALEAWLKVRHRLVKPASCDALFISQQGRRMSRANLHERLKAHGARVGMPEIHSHLFRHRRAGDVVAQVGLQEGSKLLGHRRVSTTVDEYGHYQSERLRQRILAGAPLPRGRVVPC